jgi:hypothetical protein
MGMLLSLLSEINVTEEDCFGWGAQLSYRATVFGPPVDATFFTGRALVGSHPFPRFLQHIAPIDPVVQRVKPELRFLLRLLIEFLSQ